MGILANSQGGELQQIDTDFFSALGEFSRLLSRFGCQTIPLGRPESVQRYLGLPLDRRIVISERFHTYRSVCESVAQSGQSLRDSSIILWKMLSRLKFRPGTDLFDKLDQDDVIEIYDSSSVQIFRNLRFFEICSYSLLEVFTFELWELYRRDMAITNALVQTVTGVFSNKTRTSVPAGVPDHTVEEIFSEAKRKYFIRQKFIAPLFDSNNQPIAVCGNFSVLKDLTSH
jgi:hypothetical protein